MRLSLNEVEVTARKAALGAGLPLGLAEEAGAIAYWLAAAGFAVAPLIARALGELALPSLAMEEAPGGWRLVGQPSPLSAIVAAPSACDLVIAAAKQGRRARVRAAVDLPAIALAACAVASGRAHLSLTLAIGAEPWPGPRGLDARDIARLAALREREVTIAPGQPETTPFSAIAPAHDGVEVDPAEWAAVQALADRMLVPATRHSRERGAGAGLIDTD